MSTMNLIYYLICHCKNNLYSLKKKYVVPWRFLKEVVIYNIEERLINFIICMYNMAYLFVIILNVTLLIKNMTF